MILNPSNEHVLPSLEISHFPVIHITFQGDLVGSITDLFWVLVNEAENGTMEKMEQQGS